MLGTIAHAIGNRVLGRGPSLWRHAEQAASRFLLRRDPRVALLYALHRSRPEVVFVQVGSNDADVGDPLAPFLDDPTWTGVLIEPVPYVFERLVQKHGRNERLRFENVALAPEPGERPFFFLAESADALPAWYDQLGSFSKEVILSHESAIPDVRERLVEVTVACRTFDAVCETHGLGHLDLLHIDTEGADYDILRTVDLGRLRPSVLIYEHVHLSPADTEAARSLVASAGYEHVEIGQDAVCVDAEALERHGPLAEVWARMSMQAAAPRT